MIFKSIPTFFYVLTVYNALAFLGGNGELLDAVWLDFTLMSGAPFRFTVEHALLSLGVILLFVEIYRATLPSRASVLNHAISMIVLITFIVEFTVARQLGRPGFFILGLMSFLDVVAGFTISISTARRDVSIVS